MTLRHPATWLGPTRISNIVDRCYSALAPLRSTVCIPAIRDRVHIEGHDEIFFVIYVDARRRIADVVCGERVGFLSDVPLSAIRPASSRRKAA